MQTSDAIDLLSELFLQPKNMDHILNMMKKYGVHMPDSIDVTPFNCIYHCVSMITKDKTEQRCLFSILEKKIHNDESLHTPIPLFIERLLRIFDGQIPREFRRILKTKWFKRTMDWEMEKPAQYKPSQFLDDNRIRPPLSREEIMFRDNLRSRCAIDPSIESIRLYWNNSKNDYPQYSLPIENSADFMPKKAMNRLFILDQFFNAKKREPLYYYQDPNYLATRGYSICRICSEQNGSCEMWISYFVIPNGYIHYLSRHHVAIDPILYCYIMLL